MKPLNNGQVGTKGLFHYSEVVLYLGVANVLIVYKNKLVYCMLSVSVHYWECPLIEVLLCI